MPRPALQRGERTASPVRRRRRFSVATILVPIVLCSCVYVVSTILGSARWTLDYDAAAQATTAPRVAPRWHTTRPGDTWKRVAREAHITRAELHRLNPNDTAIGKLVPGERLLLRP
jgi:hypothetical protein